MPKIVHLGIGNFHRAHQAWYTQQANHLGGEQWSIVGVSLKRPHMRDALAPQGFEYTLAIKDAHGTRYDHIGVHENVLVAPENPPAIVYQIADAETAIVTLTVTEKGYHIDPATGGLDRNSADISKEIANGTPTSAIGYLVHGLSERHRHNGGSITILSCDNLAGNGTLLETLVRDFAIAAGMNILPYLEKSVTFPNSMVDRIVPATTDALRNEVEHETGIKDASPVSTEVFSEWVIEDNFAGPRPQWENVGVTIVEDVEPFELRKLRLLNGAHSLLAYSGLLQGCTYVHEAVANPDLRGLAKGLMGEATETLPEAIQPDAPAYCEALFDRFANPSLNHELAQIAMDGSVKLPVRIVSVLEKQPGSAPTKFASMTISCWLAFIIRELESNTQINDPRHLDFERLYDATQDRKTLAEEILNCLGPVSQPSEIIDQALSMHS